MRGMYGSLCLGVDPGLANCGFALVAETAEGNLKIVHTHLVTTHRELSDDPTARISDDDTRRMVLIQRAMVGLLGEYKPALIGIETYVPIAGKGGNGAYKVGAVYGAVHALATSANRPVYAATPQDIRRALLGSPSGTKKDIERAIGMVCTGVTQALEKHKKSDREHVADAIAHAVYALDRTRVTRRMAQQLRKRITIAHEVDAPTHQEATKS